MHQGIASDRKSLLHSSTDGGAPWAPSHVCCAQAHCKGFLHAEYVMECADRLGKWIEKRNTTRVRAVENEE